MARRHDSLEHKGKRVCAFTEMAAALRETIDGLEQKKQLASVPSSIDTELNELRKIAGRLDEFAGVEVKDLPPANDDPDAERLAAEAAAAEENKTEEGNGDE